MDHLAPLFTHFSLNARVFYSGTLCTTVDFAEKLGWGYLHVLRKGHLRVNGHNTSSIEITEPTLLLFPRSHRHQFQVDDPSGAELVCAFIDFGGAMGNPLLSGLPNTILAPMSAIPGIENVITLLFEEAFAEKSGRQAAIDRLAEYCFMLILRHAIDTQQVEGGALAGLADGRLNKAITAIHQQPEHSWTLEELASTAAMSRARFAAHFRETVGITPLEFVTNWRVCIACTLLKKSMSLKMIAPAVGYGSASALTKAFTKKEGLSPMAWLKSLKILQKS